MKHPRYAPFVALSLLVAFVVVMSSGLASAPAGRRPIQLEDILAWKGVTAAEVSPDGRWLGHRVSPVDDDSEVIIRETRGTKEYRIPVGEVGDAGGPGGPGGAVGPSQAVQFSQDSTWGAVTVMPSKKEAAQLKKQKKPLENKVTLLNLGTGDKMEVPRIRRFAFSGEAATWIALHRYPVEAAPSGAPAGGGGATGAAAAAGGARPKPSDLPGDAMFYDLRLSTLTGGGDSAGATACFEVRL